MESLAVLGIQGLRASSRALGFRTSGLRISRLGFGELSAQDFVKSCGAYLVISQNKGTPI